MKKETVIYTDAPPDVEAAMDRAVIVADFLPSPQEIAHSIKKQRISILLDGDSIDFFKSEADKHGVKYQTMINSVLKSYARSHATQ
jgi:predicted DNA binding CopG/RHH family protein